MFSNDYYQKDDIFSSNENISRNAFKSRALCPEYSLYNEILFNKLKVKERPRDSFFQRN